MSTAVLKGISIVGFWLVVMVICPLPLYSRLFNPPLPSSSTSSLSGGSGASSLLPVGTAAKLRRAAAQRAKLAETICSFANSLSGGLFLALGMIHLLPEAAESFAELYGEETVDKYRPAFAVAFLSYTLLLVIQRVVFGEHGHSHGGGGDGDDDHDEGHEHHHQHQHHDRDGDEHQQMHSHRHVFEREDLASLLPHNNNHGADAKAANTRREGATASTYGSLTHHQSYRDDDAAYQQHQQAQERTSTRRSTLGEAPPPSSSPSKERSDTAVFVDDHHSAAATVDDHDSSSLRRRSSVVVGRRRPSVVVGDGDGSKARARSSIHASSRRSDVLVSIVLDHAAPDEIVAVRDDHEPEHRHQHHDHLDGVVAVPSAPTTTKVVTSIVLMLAFALHGFAEGMALGVQEDTDSVGLMIIAIAMHKWAEAMSIGLSFQKSGMPKKYCMMYIVAFSFSSPVGIGVGWASEVLLPEAITAYLLAFSTGTFLYLGASDAIVEEFAHSSGGGALRRWIKLAFYMAGAVLIFLISVYFDKDGGGDNSAGGGE